MKSWLLLVLSAMVLTSCGTLEKRVDLTPARTNVVYIKEKATDVYKTGAKAEDPRLKAIIDKAEETTELLNKNQTQINDLSAAFARLEKKYSVEQQKVKYYQREAWICVGIFAIFSWLSQMFVTAKNIAKWFPQAAFLQAIPDWVIRGITAVGIPLLVICIYKTLTNFNWWLVTSLLI